MRHRESSRIGEFELVGEKQQGYSVSEVDDYLARLGNDYSLLRQGQVEGILTSEMIRQAVFASEAGGYKPASVDGVLDQVEERFAELENRFRREKLGQRLWEEEVELLAELLLGRLNRPAGERFRRPSQRLVKGYFVRDVDSLCDLLLERLSAGQMFDLELVRGARFRSATGDMCYEETQVDAFLDRCVQLALEVRA